MPASSSGKREKGKEGLRILPDTQIEGPAIIEEPNTTIVIPPQAKAIYSNLGSYIVDLSELV